MSDARLTAMGIRRAAIVFVTVAVAAAVLAAPAAASCVMPQGSLKERLAKEKIVFVGTVANVQAQGRLAHVAVESVWRGDVEDEVEVTGGTLASNTASSVDRSFKTGERYLFVPYRGNGKKFEDSSCSDTQKWRPQLARLQPANARTTGETPVDNSSEGPVRGTEGTPSDEGSGSLPWVAGGAAVVVLLLGGAVLLRRRATA
jgi:hypothetical protein